MYRKRILKQKTVLFGGTLLLAFVALTSLSTRFFGGERITHAAAQNVVIGFDQDGTGNDIPSGEPIDDEYASWGVHFDGTYSVCRNGASNCHDLVTNSSLNILCTFALADSNECSGPNGGNVSLEVWFDFPIQFATIEGYTRNDGQEDADGLRIDAYDENGNLVAADEVICRNVAPFTIEAVCDPSVTGSGIRHLVISPIEFVDGIDTLTYLAEMLAPEIDVFPTSLDYGQIETGTTRDLTVTITNVGTADLIVSDLMTTNPVFTILSPAVPLPIAPGSSEVVTIRFSPLVDGIAAGQLNIFSNDADESVVSVPLVGVGFTPEVPHPCPDFPAEGVDFGDAPDPIYPTLFANNGAHHCDFTHEWLGITVDAESDAKFPDNFDDGFRLTSSNYPNRRFLVTVNTSGMGAARYGVESDRRLYLQIWVDYNRDGDWDDAGEEAVVCDLAPGTMGQCNGRPTNWRRVDQPAFRFPVRYNLRSQTPGSTWVRARLTYGTKVDPTGPALYGEVEDFEEIIFIR